MDSDTDRLHSKNATDFILGAYKFATINAIRVHGLSLQPENIIYLCFNLCLIYFLCFDKNQKESKNFAIHIIFWITKVENNFLTDIQ